MNAATEQDSLELYLGPHVALLTHTNATSGSQATIPVRRRGPSNSLRIGRWRRGSGCFAYKRHDATAATTETADGPKVQTTRRSNGAALRSRHAAMANETTQGSTSH